MHHMCVAVEYSPIVSFTTECYVNLLRYSNLSKTGFSKLVNRSVLCDTVVEKQNEKQFGKVLTGNVRKAPCGVLFPPSRRIC